MKLQRSILFAGIALVAETSSGAVPAYISTEHALLLERWLLTRPALRLAVDADCQCDRDLASMRGDSGDPDGNPDYQPFYATADFNDDGQADFAVLTVTIADASRRFLVVFNGPLAENADPAFVGRADGILVLSRPSSPPRRLLVGPPYADAAVLTPEGPTYRLIWAEQ